MGSFRYHGILSSLFFPFFLHSTLPVFFYRQNLSLCNPRLASNSCLSLLSNSWEFRCVPRPSLTYILFYEGFEHPCSMIFTVGSYKQARIAVCGTADSTSLRPTVLAVVDLDLLLDRWKLRLPRIWLRKTLDSFAFWSWVRMMGLFCIAEEAVRLSRNFWCCMEPVRHVYLGFISRVNHTQHLSLRVFVVVFLCF